MSVLLTIKLQGFRLISNIYENHNTVILDVVIFMSFLSSTNEMPPEKLCLFAHTVKYNKYGIKLHSALMILSPSTVGSAMRVSYRAGPLEVEALCAEEIRCPAHEHVSAEWLFANKGA